MAERKTTEAKGKPKGADGIYPKAKGVWKLVISLGKDPETGKYRQYAETFTGKLEDAKARRGELLHKHATGMLLIDPTGWTVAEYLEHWLSTYVTQNCRPKTQLGYRTLVKNLVVPLLGNVLLAKLTGAHVQKAYSTLLTKGRLGGRPLSARTVLHTHRVLSEALGHAVKWQMIPRNVADLVDPPKPQPKEMQVWDADEARRFLAAVTAKTDDGDEAVLYGTALAFALQTGVRQCEVLGLRWRDVDLDQRAARILHTLQRVNGRGLIAGQPKTNRGRRRIGLTPSIVNLLRAHKAGQNKEKLRLGPDYQENGLVFATPLGTPIDPMTIYHSFVRACQAAGVRRIPFHGMRHTHATLLLSRNVNAKIVSERLGHAGVAITMDIYSHVLPDMQDVAVRQLEDIFQETPPAAAASQGS